MTPFIAEIIGTMLMILLGNGVVANVVLTGTKGNSGWIVITTGWQFYWRSRGRTSKWCTFKPHRYLD
jgi:glycerol uptake facilitator-like aquaporin